MFNRPDRPYKPYKPYKPARPYKPYKPYRPLTRQEIIKKERERIEKLLQKQQERERSKRSVFGEERNNIDSFLATPAEEQENIYKVTIKDERCEKPFIFNLQWTGKLRKGEVINNVKTPNQEEIVNTFCNSKNKSGFIIAPPRTGKSVIGVAITCRLRVKTLIITNQIDLLENFYKSFERDTNLIELQNRTKKAIVKVIKTSKDLQDFFENPEDYDIVLCTYQRFIGENGEKKRKLLNGKFGFLIVDEAHTVGAEEFFKFCFSLDCKYKLALTATPYRKDGADKLSYKIIGDIIYKASNLSLIPELHIVETGIKIKDSGRNEMGGFARYENRLSDDPNRRKLILDMIFSDLEKHQCIIIPLKRVLFQEELTKMINERAKRLGMILPGEKIAEVFEGALPSIKRKEILKEVESGKIRVLVSSLQIMQQGIDLVTPTCIYISYPMSATPTAPTAGQASNFFNPEPENQVGCPKFFQLVNRICTPTFGKQQPIVKIFVDDSQTSRSCFNSLWRWEIKAGLKAENHRSKHPIYKLGDDFVDYIYKRESSYVSNEDRILLGTLLGSSGTSGTSGSSGSFNS